MILLAELAANAVILLALAVTCGALSGSRPRRGGRRDSEHDADQDEPDLDDPR